MEINIYVKLRKYTHAFCNGFESNVFRQTQNQT